MHTRVVALFVALMVAPLQSSAGADGAVYFGGGAIPSDCGGCHFSFSPTLTIQRSGPDSVSVGTFNQYTMRVDGVTASYPICGIDIATDSGELFEAFPSTQLIFDQVTHTQQNQSCSFTFTWLAPAAPGTSTFRATAIAGSSANNRDDRAVPLTAFPITVLPEPSPNMLLAIAVATLTLASGGRAPEQRPLRRTRRRRWSTAHRGAAHSRG